MAECSGLEDSKENQNSRKGENEKESKYDGHDTIKESLCWQNRFDDDFDAQT